MPADPTTPFRCSSEARQRREPLAGTALGARRWLLVEQPGPWESQAMRTPPLDAPVGKRLVAAAESVPAEVLLVRPPGRRAVTAARRWTAVDSPSRTMTVGEWSTPADLALAAGRLAAPGPFEQPMDQPAILVCTHSSRDLCCAVRGRSVAAELALRWPGLVWESSHLGGHRFAATVLVLPEGAQYGYLDADNAVSVIADHRDGRVAAPYLRGVCGVAPPGQVAAVAALERYGPAAVSDVRVDSVTETDPGVWRVRLLGAGRIPARLVAVVRAGPGEAHRLSCRDDPAKTVPSWQVVSLGPEGDSAQNG